MANNGTEFVAGFLLGAVAGAAIGLVFAPQSGEETRQQIKDQTIELKGKAEEAGARSRTILEDRVSKLESMVNRQSSSMTGESSMTSEG
jgi:gas vesicle protein